MRILCLSCGLNLKMVFLFSRNKAVTLIELLIASSIFAITAVTVYSAFNSGVFGSKNIEEAIGVYQGARQILERINLDLRNSFAYSDEETKFTGGPDALSFLTLTDSYKEDKIAQDYTFVAYAFTDNKLTRLHRKNKDALNDESETETEEMAQAEAVTFSYGFIEDSGGTLQWNDSWDDPKALPVAVRIVLSLKNKIKQDFERTIYLSF